MPKGIPLFGGHLNQPKVPDDLLPEIVKMRAEGKTLTDIQAWLISAHNISVDVSNISRRLKFSIKMDRQLAKAVYARASAMGAESIINLLINNLDEIHQVSNCLLAEGNMAEARLWKGLELQYLKQHVELTGVSEMKVEDELEDIDELLGRLNGAQMINPMLPEGDDNE